MSEFSEQLRTPLGQWVPFNNFTHWLGGVSPEQDDRPSRVDLLRRKKALDLYAFGDIVGSSVHVGVTHPLLRGGGHLPPLRDREGRIIVWDLWFPHKKLLFEQFKGPFSDDDVNIRLTYAEEHGLSYGFCEPGRRITPSALKVWLEERETP